MRNGQLSFVKTTNYEISKPRKYKADVGRIQNMEHREEKDEHLCKNGKSLTVSGIRKQKSRSGYKWETTIKGTTAPLYPILIILSFYLFLYKGSSDNLSLKNRFPKMNLCMHKDEYEAPSIPVCQPSTAESCTSLSVTIQGCSTYRKEHFIIFLYLMFTHILFSSLYINVIDYKKQKRRKKYVFFNTIKCPL